MDSKISVKPSLFKSFNESKVHNVHWGINPLPPQKHHPLFFLPKPLLNL